MIEKTISSNIIYSGKLINVRCDQVALKDGRTCSREIVDHAPAVVIMALTDDNHSSVSIAKLYIGKGGDLAEGNSLFIKKDNPKNDRHIATFGVSARDFFHELALYLDDQFKDYEVLLRLNCEGVEDDVIYSTFSSFGNKLKLICGSLKDVEELKGLEASQKLDKFMSCNNLLFVKFSSGIYTWPDAHKAVLKLLEKDDKLA